MLRAREDSKLDALRRALHARAPLLDADFDEVYPIDCRRISGHYWTPVTTARRATELLVGEGARRILDIGAGVGKFCIVGAASTANATFVGVEQRPHLVDIARSAIERLAVSRVEMVHATVRKMDTTGFDGFYLYNPFAENLYARSARLDSSVMLSKRRYQKELETTAAIFDAAREGTCVVTFYGYGGLMPEGYDLVHVERSYTGFLCLWVKSGATGARWRAR